MVSQAVSLGLIGWPVKHSFSAEYFARKFQQLGIEGTYKLIPLQKISSLYEALEKYGVTMGFNVTIPHKRDIIPILDAVSPEAAEIGAVNTVKIVESPYLQRIQLLGFNTDYIGFMDSLTPLLSPDIRNALVLGYGGAARAVIYCLIKLGIRPTVVSRHPERCREERMCGDCLNFISYSDISEGVMAENLLVVNTTPLGMWPNVENCPDLPWQWLSMKHLCYDLVYNPENTRFMTEATKRGARVKNGMDMLRLQADAAWKIWTGLQE